jgi:hypothetical protein
MKWTFGIVTGGNEVHRLNCVLESIISKANDDYQIIVIGGKDKDIAFEGVDHIPFDESIKPLWITRKKNQIAQAARHQNICLLHDYVALRDNWFEGFELFGEEWIACVNRVENNDGTRHIDWAVIFHDAWMNPPVDDQEVPQEYGPGRLLRYDIKSWIRWQYYPGFYFCVKKDTLLETPLDESIVWGQGEDVRWSRELYARYGSAAFKFNPHSQVCFLKQKPIVPWQYMPEIAHEIDGLQAQHL